VLWGSCVPLGFLRHPSGFPPIKSWSQDAQFYFPCHHQDKKGRGIIFHEVCKTIRAKRPRCYVLENVVGLITLDQGAALKKVMAKLRAIPGYIVKWAVLNTNDHGIPHCRKRWYCVGILPQRDDHEFSFPAKLGKVDLEEFLDPPDSVLALSGAPSISNLTAFNNVVLGKWKETVFKRRNK
jgi:site-specific DNA-cytosine methylase